VTIEDLVGERLMIGLPGPTVRDEDVRLFRDTRAGGLILYQSFRRGRVVEDLLEAEPGDVVELRPDLQEPRDHPRAPDDARDALGASTPRRDRP